MHPRWKKDDGMSNWVARGYTYLGGTAKYDLWCEYISNPHQIRIVCGDAPEDWDYINFNRADYFKARTYFNDVKMTEEEVQEVETYLKLFAPWVLGEALTKKEESET